MFVVLDLETTGLRCSHHEIIEMAAIKVEVGKDRHAAFHSLVVPSKRVSARITQLTGLNRDMLVRDGKALAAVVPSFLSFCEKLPLVAFNAPFDRMFIEAACERLGHTAPSASRWKCALQLARRAWPYRKSHKLTSLAADAGLSIAGAHRALVDCQNTAHIFALATRVLTGA
ncbi:PolC-type DNA polymerase III [Sphingomonas ginkgonis]|uniref:3'-5' exonuclease n=1 Tax=Sphingomonas ginkgonis TaxID=2315330 RepID=UPI00163B4A26|nr:3'-5' exonuclease [Sphingomonas ginkgonis]